MDDFTISKMAKLNNISAQTLRLYEKIGLIRPEFVNTENGYRYYNIKQSARLDIIQYMKSLGMKLSDIKVLLDKNDTSMLKAVLESHNEHIDKQIETLKYQKRAIERTLESYERFEKMPPEGTISLEFIGKRYMYCIDCGINFYDYEIDTYEKLLRDFKENLIKNDLPKVYFYNVGTILRKNNLENHKYFSSEIFVFVDKEFAEEKQTIVIPSNTYLCIYCRKFESEKKYIDKLLETIVEKRYKIIGDYICETLAELPVFKDNQRDMILRLQIPVRFC